MKKMLFISNITNKITNFSLPSIKASQSLGYEFHLAANLSNFKDDISKYNIMVHHIDLARNPFSWKNIKAYNQMIALIKEEGYDVIHCNTPIGGVLGRLCGNIAKVPKIIYTVHGFHFYNGAPLINRTFYKWIEMWMARYTDSVITINQEDFNYAKTFKLRNKGRVYYVPGVGVDTLMIKEAKEKRLEIIKEIEADNDSILIISVGELNENKNNEVIIGALSKLNNSKIHYIMCGTGKKKDYLLNMINKKNLKNNVHFLEYRSDIAQLLNSVDIFVMPSYREGLSRSIMEAMSAKLPCVVSKIRGNVDLVDEGKGGYLCHPDDIEGFANAIKSLSNDTKLRKNMGEYNLNKINKFDTESVLKELKKIYEKELLLN